MADESFRCVTFQKLIDQGLLEVGDGYRAKNEELGGSGPLFLRAGHVTDTHIDFDGVERFHASLADKVRAKMALPGDTIMTTKGNSTGRTSYVTERMPPFVYSPHLSYWRSRDAMQLANGFLRYWSRSSEFVRQLSGMKASTDMAPYLSLTDQRRLRITLPPPSEQRAIACILGALDDKIELNRRRNRTLEAMARAIFQSWFVDFEPVKAKAAGRTPLRLKPEIAALFPDAFEDSALGPIPKGWRVRNLAAACEIIFSGGTPSTQAPAYWNGDIPWLSSGETRSKFIIDTEKTITQAGIDNSSTRFARAGVTVIASAGQGNTRGQTSMLTIDSYINQSVVALAARPDVSSDVHLFFDLERRYDQFRQVSDSHSSRGSLTTKLLAELFIVLPQHFVVGAFDGVVRPLVCSITTNLHESRTLAALRDALLPKLISGELRVPDAERIVARAV
ncbi:MAG: restriction endonuclease subunit S [Gemmataceae bacterium]